MFSVIVVVVFCFCFFVFVFDGQRMSRMCSSVLFLTLSHWLRAVRSIWVISLDVSILIPS